MTNLISFFLFLFSFPIIQSQINEHTPLTVSDTKPLQPGSHLPKAFIRNIYDDKINLMSLVKTKPTIIIFYRGGWCPYCNLQLQNLRKIDSTLVALGYQIIAISPDSPDELKKSIEKHNLSYQLFSDSKMDVAKDFGIAFRLDGTTVERYKNRNMDIEASSGENHHLIPVPSVFIVGTDGIIKYVYSNPDYKIRMDIEELLSTASKFK